MRNYVKASGQYIDEVNGVKIYDDGNIYIYTDPKGKGRMEFPTRGEAEVWIEENMPNGYTKGAVMNNVRTRRRNITAGRICYPWVMIGEFEDGYSYEMPGNDIGDCIYKLQNMESKHGDLVWYGGLNDEEYVDGEYIGSCDEVTSSRQIAGSRKVSWNDLSEADQMAVEYASQYMESGEEMEDACRRGCRVVSEGNAESEYEDEEFYMEEPDFNRVYDYMRSTYFKVTSSRKISNSHRKSIKANASPEGVELYRNLRNENKYIEVKHSNDGHTYFRQFMYWNMEDGPVKNYNGSKTNRGRFHRVRQDTLKGILEDYEQVDDVHTEMDVLESTQIPSDDLDEFIDTYYDRVTWDEICHMVGWDEEDPEFASDVPGYSDLKHIDWLVTKNKYSGVDTYNILELVSENGRNFLAFLANDRVYDVTDEVMSDFDY